LLTINVVNYLLAEPLQLNRWCCWWWWIWM